MDCCGRWHFRLSRRTRAVSSRADCRSAIQNCLLVDVEVARKMAVWSDRRWRCCGRRRDGERDRRDWTCRSM